MNRIVLILFGVVGLTVWAWFCVQRHATAIETDLSARSRITLDQELMDWARIQVDGRDSVLTGIAPSEESRAAAEALIARVDGMRSVQNELDVVAEPEPRAAELTPGPAPYELTIQRTDDGVILRGVVPNATARAELREAAGRYFGDDFVAELEIAAGAPGDWLDVAKGGLHHLSALEDGTVRLRNTRLRVKGTAIDEDARKQIEDAIANQTPVTYSAHAEITISPQTILKRCQERFDLLLKDRQIRFAPGSAIISPESYPLLDELAAAARSCPHAHFAMTGHTDSTGSAGANQALSEDRAASVVAYLIEAGIPADRQSSAGHGESQPVADNDTAEGRARNRRIEIKVHQGSRS